MTVSDPDDNIASIVVSGGSYINGTVCFLPYDSGHYEMIATVTDSCGLVVVDTAIIAILTDQGVSVQCPNDTTIFMCSADTLCFPVTGFSDSANVTITGINTWYDSAMGSVCFYSCCPTTNQITVTVTTGCNSIFSDTLVVTTTSNSAPLVFLPPDTTLPFSNSVEICQPVGISDPESNIDSIWATGGLYDPTYSKVCFTPDTPGTYIISVTAMDSCGAQRTDSMTITLNCCTGITGNVDFDPADVIDISDLTYFTRYFFLGGPPPPCFLEGDIDRSGSMDIADQTYLVAFMFTGGPQPPPCPLFETF